MDLQVDTELIAACARVIEDAGTDMGAAMAPVTDKGGPLGTTAGSAPVREAHGAGIRGSALAVDLVLLSARYVQQAGSSLRSAASAFDLVESTTGG